MFTLSDVLAHTMIQWENNIPHERGFYILFNFAGMPIYVGEGWLDDRIKTHFNSDAGTEYYNDACYCLWILTFDKNVACAYERAIYDDFASKGIPLTRNRKRPTGVPGKFPNYFAKIRLELAAIADWRSLLRNIAIQKL